MKRNHFQKRSLLMTILWSIVISFLSTNVTFAQIPPTDLYEEGVIYLKTKKDYTTQLNYVPGTTNPSQLPIYTIFSQYGVTSINQPFIAFPNPLFTHIYRVRFTNSNVQSFMDALSLLSFIEYVERVPVKKITSITPNDPKPNYYLQQINAFEAFDLHTGGAATVAIVDNAIEYDHEDLEANMVAGYDVADLDNDPSPISTTGAINHGTLSSGIAGAVTDNGKGISSIGWNNKIMPIKTVKDTEDANYLSYAYDGITWAAVNGADIISMSFEGPEYSKSEYLVIKQAKDLGSILVAAAGNTGSSNPHYPAAYGEGTTGQPWEIADGKLVIAVAAIDPGNNGATFTSFGNWVDVSAYGVGLTSTTVGELNGSPIYNQYSSYSGTSASTPMVAGLAGLMKSYAPSKSNDEIISCLLNTANSDIYNPVTHPKNIPNTLGSGRIDAYQALLCLNQSCQSPLAVIFPSLLDICPGTSATLTANEGVSYLWSTSETTRSININSIGTYTVTVTFSGNCTASKSITVTPTPTDAIMVVTESSGAEPNDGIICGNDYFTISAIWGTGYNWTSGPPDPALLFSANNQLGTLSFTVTVSDVGGCVGVTDVVTKTVEIKAYPNATLQLTEVSGIQNDGLICIGSPVTLKAMGGNQYLWSNGATNPTINVNPTTSTTYTVTVTTSGGCSTTLEQVISVSTCQPVDDCFSCLPSGIKITASNSGTKYSTLNLPTTLSTPICLSISGKLIIDIDVSILNTGIVLGSGAEIIVGDVNSSSPVKLTIQGCSLGSCNQMWRGIKVLSQNHLIFKDNQIQDAEYAITAIPSYGPSSLSPRTKVEITNNKFYSNHVGFYVPNGEWWGNIEHFPFSGNTFYKSPYFNLKPPTDVNLSNYNAQKSFAGIVISGLSEFTVGSPNGIGFDNTFNYLRNGIISTGSTWLTVFRADFDDLYDYFGTSGTASINNSTGIGILANGGIINVSSSRFNKCGHGVYANSSFLGINNNKMPEVNVGIQTNFPISFSINDITQPQQSISFKYNALLARNLNKWLNFSAYKVENNHFSHHNSTNGDSDNPEAAIDIDNANNPNMDDGKAKIDNNVFDFTGYFDGIRVSNLNNWDIYDNTINLTSASTSISKGIILNNANASYLLNNTVNSSYASPNPAGTRGIQVNLSAETELCCNHTYGTTIGTEFVGPCENTDLKTGDFDGNIYSIMCSEATMLGDQPDLQMGLIENNGNMFSGTSGKAEHLGGFDFISDSEFRVKENSQPSYPPEVSTPNSPTAEWFKTTGKDPIACTSCVDPARPSRGERVLDTDLHFVDGTYHESPYGTMVEWEGQMRLFNQLKKTPSMISLSETIGRFYTSAESGVIGQFWNVENAIEKITELPENMMASIGSVWEHIQTNESAYESVLKSLNSATNLEDRNIILQNASEIRAEGLNDYHAFLENKHYLDSLRTIRCENALLLNRNLPETNILQSNRKAVNEVYLEYLKQIDSTPMSDEQFAIISNIAHQCPLEGGTAVYKARSLYQIWEHKYFEDDQLCAQTGERKLDTKTISPENFSLIPNPAHNNVTAIIPKSIAANSIVGIRLMDMSGRIVFNRTLQYSTGTNLDFDISNLQNGIYFCLVSENGKSIAQTKLIIQH